MAITNNKWNKIDGRKIPDWFDDDKLGIFIHWGLYSVPAYAPKREQMPDGGLPYAEWYAWQVRRDFKPFSDFHNRVYGKDFPYEKFAESWQAELFDPKAWAKLFAYAGAKYIALVAKHHDGFCLWPSSYSPEWNSIVKGPRKDITGLLLDEVEKAGIRRGVYYSLLEWKHPLIKELGDDKQDFKEFSEKKMMPELKELVEKYRPEFLFTDGEWTASADDWGSQEFLEWLITSSCVKDSIVFNDRWGNDTRGVHGGNFTSEYGEINSAAVDEDEAKNNLSKRKWEECRSISYSFGFNRNENAEDYLSEFELIDLFVKIIAKGGNLLLNVSPCADGTITPLIQERLIQLGDWMKINSESIYKTKKCSVICPSFATAVKKESDIFVHLRKYIKDEFEITLENDRLVKAVSILGGASANFKQAGKKLKIKLPILWPDQMPCRCVYTLKIQVQ